MQGESGEIVERAISVKMGFHSEAAENVERGVCNPVGVGMMGGAVRG